MSGSGAWFALIVLVVGGLVALVLLLVALSIASDQDSEVEVRSLCLDDSKRWVLLLALDLVLLFLVVNWWPA